MDPVTITQPTNSDQVTIGWVAPSANGSPITAYRLQLLNDQSGLYIDSPLCPQSLSLSCVISMSNIIGTLQYRPGITLKAIVQAQNSMGWSVISNPNSQGIFAQIAPTASVTGL
jgi:hypothetical protein